MFKVCPHCGKVVSYNSYFHAWICECGFEIEERKNENSVDYKRLSSDLLSGCKENCADCDYAGDGEFECTITQVAATTITDLLSRAEAAEAERDKLKVKLGLASAALKAKVSEIPDTTEDDLRKAEMVAAVEWATHELEDKLQAAEARAEKAEKERDGLVISLNRIDAAVDILLNIVKEKFGPIETCGKSGQKEK